MKILSARNIFLCLAIQGFIFLTIFLSSGSPNEKSQEKVAESPYSCPTSDDFENLENENSALKEKLAQLSKNGGDNNNNPKPSLLVDDDTIRRTCNWRNLRSKAFSKEIPCLAENVRYDWSHLQCFWDLYQPTTECSSKERVGYMGDGGKWVCDFEEIVSDPDPCILFSFGVRDEVSFEEAFTNRGCKTYSFDPTPGVKQLVTPKLKPGMHFYEIGLGPYGDSFTINLGGRQVPLKSLGQLAKELKVPKIDVLKIDIEGSEWTAVPYFLKEEGFAALGVKTIMIELHYNAGNFQHAIGWFQALEDAGYQIHYKESNNWCPQCFEYAWKYVGKIDCTTQTLINEQKTLSKNTPKFAEILNINVFERFVTGKKNGLFIDVGANHGDFTAGYFLNDASNTVLMYEPSPKNQKTLESRFASIQSTYPNIQLFKAAVSSKNGILSLWNSETCDANPSLANQDFAQMEGCNFQKVEVKVVTLDETVKEVNEQKWKLMDPQDWKEVGILKIDTQGYDMHVLEGATSLLENKKILAILSEFWPNGLEAAGTNPAAFIRYLNSWGFVCYNNPGEAPLGDGYLNTFFRIDKPEQFVKDIKAVPYRILKHGSYSNIVCIHQDQF